MLLYAYNTFHQFSFVLNTFFLPPSLSYSPCSILLAQANSNRSQACYHVYVHANMWGSKHAVHRRVGQDRHSMESIGMQ